MLVTTSGNQKREAKSASDVHIPDARNASVRVSRDRAVVSIDKELKLNYRMGFVYLKF